MGSNRLSLDRSISFRLSEISAPLLDDFGIPSEAEEVEGGGTDFGVGTVGTIGAGGRSGDVGLIEGGESLTGAEVDDP